LVVVTDGNDNVSHLIADPKKVEVSGGATDFVCGVRPDGEVRVLYFEK
jgi:hypothetical protein